MNENEVKKITAVEDSTVNKIRRKTAYGLPDNPSAVGMKPAEIKRAFYESIVGQAISLISEINRIVKEANEVFEAYEASNDEKLSKKLDVYTSVLDNVVYAAQKDGTQAYVKYSSTLGALTLMLRDAENRSQIGDPAEEDDIANKRYVDTLLTELKAAYQDIAKELSKKLDAYTLASDNVVYAVTEEGLQDYIRYDSGLKPNTLMFRSSEGRSQIDDPVGENDIANKRYVDAVLENLAFIKVVDTLPEMGESNKFYFVPKADSDDNDLFDEYVWVEGSWEWITTKQIKVDLMPYAKTEYINGKLTEKLDKVTSASGNLRLYGISYKGTQRTVDARSTAYSYTIPVRNGDGTFSVGTPTEPSDAVPKSYVDDAVGNIETVLDNIIAIQNSLIGGETV